MTKKIEQMDAALLCRFLQQGSEYLGQHKDEVNALNVFPVPDGDTGINMYLTVNAAASKLRANGHGVGRVAGDFAQGTLMGARGNSGVILSQIFRGFASSLAGKRSVDALELAAAMQKGVDLSYKSVMKPVEGTILTVYREYAAAAAAAAESGADIVTMLRRALKAGEKALEHTPDLLPVLKEAGVVDAGGKGLLCIFEGALLALSGEQPAVVEEMEIEAEPEAAETPAIPQSAIADQDIEFTYCTQLLIKGENLPLEQIRERLSQQPPGDSLLVVGDETLIKIHFHNNHPGQVLEYCAQFGSLHDIIIDNMRDQHHQTIIDAEQAEMVIPSASAASLAHCGVIAVCCGEQMAELYEELGATVISGGQTMNPSAEDLVHAVEQCPAEQVVLLPNNSNIILTAGQVQYLTSKPVAVAATKFVTQGLTAMLRFDPERDAKINGADMEQAAQDMLNGELTYAVRDTKYNGFTIAANDILGLCQGEIVSCGPEIGATLLQLIEKMVAEAEEAVLLSIFYGADIEDEQAEQYAEQLAELYPDLEIELHAGGQPLYYFLLALE